MAFRNGSPGAPSTRCHPVVVSHRVSLAEDGAGVGGGSHTIVKVIRPIEAVLGAHPTPWLAAPASCDRAEPLRKELAGTQPPL